jgi:rare lipoprotein A
MHKRPQLLGIGSVLLAAGCVAQLSPAAPDRVRPAVMATPATTVLPAISSPAAPLGVPVAAEPAREVLEVLTGMASYYANSLAGRRTASGERYDPQQFVAAHRSLPFGTILRVTNPANGNSVEVRVIDRGPFTRGRVLDVSRSAAEALGMIRRGIAPVQIEVLSRGG